MSYRSKPTIYFDCGNADGSDTMNARRVFALGCRVR